MVLMAMTPDYARGYENGKQESAARIRALEAALARKDAALRAADKALKPIADLQEKNIWRADFTQDAVDARALIAAALTEVEK